MGLKKKSVNETWIIHEQICDIKVVTIQRFIKELNQAILIPYVKFLHSC